MAPYTYPDISEGEWIRRIVASAARYRDGDIDHTLCRVAFGGDTALFCEVMRRILLGVATPAMFVPFPSSTPSRRG